MPQMPLAEGACHGGVVCGMSQLERATAPGHIDANNLLLVLPHNLIEQFCSNNRLIYEATAETMKQMHQFDLMAKSQIEWQQLRRQDLDAARQHSLAMASFYKQAAQGIAAPMAVDSPPAEMAPVAPAEIAPKEAAPAATPAAPPAAQSKQATSSPTSEKTDRPSSSGRTSKSKHKRKHVAAASSSDEDEIEYEESDDEDEYEDDDDDDRGAAAKSKAKKPSKPASKKSRTAK